MMPDDQGGGQHAREQRAQSGALGAHLRKTETSVDEDRVEADVRQVGQDRHDHFDLRVADALEKLLEGEEQHHERHAEDEHPVVGNGHFDHLDGLFEVVHQRDDGILHAGHDQSQQRVEEDAVLEQGGRADPVLLGVKLPHEGREAQRHADGGDEEDEEHGAAERHGGQRRGVAASVAADHQVVGDLREDLPQLCQHHGQRQPQVGFVLLFVCCETVHSIRVLRCKDSHFRRDCNSQTPPGAEKAPEGAAKVPAVRISRAVRCGCSSLRCIRGRRGCRPRGG